MILSELLGTDVQPFQYIEKNERNKKRETVRQRYNLCYLRLFNISDENAVGNEIMEI
jgi:hypothetical protein